MRKKWIGLFILSAIGIFSLLPAFLSTETGNRLVLSWLTANREEQLQIGHFSLSWLGPQKIEDLALLAEDGHTLVKLKSFEANTSLPLLLLKGPKPHEISMELLQVDFEKQYLNSTLVNSLAPRSSLEPLLAYFGEKVKFQLSQSKDDFWELELFSDQTHLSCGITLDKGLLRLTSPTTLKSQLADFSLTLEIDSLEFPLAALTEHLSASQKKAISFEAKATLVPTKKGNSQAATFALSSRKGSEDFLANATEFPTKLLDDFLDTGDFFEKTLGETLSVSLRSDEKDATRLSFMLHTEKMDISEGTLQLNQNGFLSGTLSTKIISFKNQKEAPIDVENSIFFWNLDPDSNLLSIHFENPFSGNAEIDLNATGLARLRAFDSKGKNVPSDLLDLLFPYPIHTALFGDQIDTLLLFHQKNGRGKLNLEAKGELGEVKMDARIENDVLVLNKPFSLTTQASETLGKTLLKEVSPLFLQLEDSDQKIHLTISPEEFALPLKTLDLQHVRIQKAVLDSGKLHFKNEGEIKKLIAALKPPKTDQVEIWTTPAYLSLEGGKLTIERTDMLIMQRYPIATWGKINFTKDKVRMTVGLTAKALSEAFDVKGLDKKSMVQIPLTGSLKKARLDASKATRKIGALLAQKSKSPEALLVGAVLALVNGKEEKPPAPTTHPFPWDKQAL